MNRYLLVTVRTGERVEVDMFDAATRGDAINEARDFFLDGLDITEYNPDVWLRDVLSAKVYEFQGSFDAGILSMREEYKQQCREAQAADEKEERHQLYLKLKAEFDDS